MKILVSLILLIQAFVFAQVDINRPANAIYKNFKPFPTPRTNYRPGSVYRFDKYGVKYFVQDVQSIKSLESDEGTVKGKMIFTRSELLEGLNIDINQEYISVEVEIKNAVREYTEQTNVDLILWENDVIENLVVDDSSKYFLIREAVTAKEITYRFDAKTGNNIVTGKSNLKEKVAGEGQIVDYPFSISKRFKEPKRLFYLEQKIGLEPYPED
jgi:hypothetical protein